MSFGKPIICCATVHAAKDLSFLVSDGRTLGAPIHSLRKNKAAIIGFSAPGGSYGRNPESLTRFAPVAANSLENQVFEGVTAERSCLDRKLLESLGVIAARPLQYTRSNRTQWSNVVDGILVVREEHPVLDMRSARPQQMAPERAVPGDGTGVTGQVACNCGNRTREWGLGRMALT